MSSYKPIISQGSLRFRNWNGWLQPHYEIFSIFSYLVLLFVDRNSDSLRLDGPGIDPVQYAVEDLRELTRPLLSYDWLKGRSLGVASPLTLDPLK
jgi:hypothetical protein